MRTRKLSAGDIIEARCTRCRAVMNHRIIAMVGEQIVRVECNTCNGAHNYHEPKEPKKAAAGSTAARKTATAPRQTRKEPGAADRLEWSELQPSMDKEKAIPYDMGRKYRLSDVIAHPTFGLGVVKTLIAPSKMEVLFEEGKKLLRCL